MSFILNSSKSISDDIRKDIISLQDMVNEINNLSSMNFKEFRNISNLWSQKMNLLNVRIKEFNNMQMAKVMHNHRISDTNKLLPLYLNANTCIQATQKISSVCNNNEMYHNFITYRNRLIGFSEFFRSQYKLSNKYILFRNSFMSLSHCVFENTREPVENKYIYGIPGPGGLNPYSNPRSSIINNKIEKTTVASISSIKKYLTHIFVAICGDNIAPITGKIARCFIAGVCAKKSVETLIDNVFLGYLYEKNKISWYEYAVDYTRGVSRHVAWCTYRTKGKHCILLDQPCHSSVSCAFYKESNIKKTGYR